MLRFNKYSSDSGDYVLVDARTQEAPRFERPEVVHALCLEYECEGLIIIEKSEAADFKASFFGRDGKKAQIPDDGLRCSVAFADVIGVKAFHSTDYQIEATSGKITGARIFSHLGESKEVGLDNGKGDYPSASTLNLGDLIE